MTRKIFFLFILFLYIVRLWPYSSVFTQKFEIKKIEQLYQYSQFADDPEKRLMVIQDWDLYPYAGISYLTQGDLGAFKIPHPPFGLYLFGLVTLLIGNPTVIQLPLGLLFLWVTFLIGEKILQSRWLAFLVSLALLHEPLFIVEVTHSLLDLLHATIIAVFLWISLTVSQKIRRTVFLGLALGAVASIKFPVPAAILATSYLAADFLVKKKINLSLPSILFIAFLFYCLNFQPAFARGGIDEVILIHYKTIKQHLSHVPDYPSLVPLRIMFLNQWPVWWDDINPIRPVAEWRFTWPFLALAILASPFFTWKAFHSIRSFLSLFIFSWGYFIFINLRLFFPGYLFLLLPYLYLFLIWEVRIMWSLVGKKISP